MGRVFLMNFLHQLNYLFSLVFIGRLPTLFPLVVTGTADAHKAAQSLDIVFSGECIDYPVFFGFKGM